MASSAPAWRNRIVGSGEEAPDQLVANPANWRTHPAAQRDALRGSLAEVGWVQQVMVNQRTGYVVDGHARVEEALSRHEPTVPVLYVDLDEHEEALVLATLDPLAAMAAQDAERLDALLSDLTASDPGLQALLDSLATPEPKVGLTDPDDVPDLGTGSTIHAGDIFALGDHRLMCGDSTSAADIERLMAGATAQMVATDPPYAIYGSSTGISTSIADDKMVRPFFEGILRLAAERVDLFGHIYVCCDWRSWPSWWEMAKRVELTPKNLIVWDKEVPGMGSSYANSYELVGFFARLPRQKVMSQNPTTGHQRQVHRPNVWRGPKVPGGKRDHNAQKPVALMQFLIENSSDPGGLVLEPFAGSGSTIIAAEQLGRRCYAMEIDPRYVAVAIKRWEDFTGRKAERVDG